MRTKQVPCVIYRRWWDKPPTDHHVLHGTAMRARRNAAITGQEFHWHEVETVIGRALRKLGR